MGTGNRFDWTQLAANGVIVVAMNYRLGALGLYNYHSPMRLTGATIIEDRMICLFASVAWFVWLPRVQLVDGCVFL